MSNPVMSQLETEFEKTPAGYPAMPGYQVGQGAQSQPFPPGQATNFGQSGFYGQGAGYDPSGSLRSGGTYSQPGLNSTQLPAPNQGVPPQMEQVQSGQVTPPGSSSRPMTLDDVLLRTGGSFLALVLAAVAGWMVTVYNPAFGMMVTVVGAIIALVAVLVASFRKTPSPTLTLVYALAEGLVLGAFSMIMETSFPGIVIQAVLGTVGVFATCLVLFKSGLVRVNGKFMKIMLVGIIGILVYRILAMVLSAFGIIGQHPDAITVFGIPLGLLVGIFAVLIGAMSLISDFDIAREGIRLGAPKEMAWSCALGIMVTVVWIYIEVLRLIAILRSVTD